MTGPYQQATLHQPIWQQGQGLSSPPLWPAQNPFWAMQEVERGMQGMARGMGQAPDQQVHWLSYTYNAPLLLDLEKGLRAEAGRVLIAHGSGILSFSATSASATNNGITHGTTKFRVGKLSPWTMTELGLLDNVLGGVVPVGMSAGQVNCSPPC
ncbi:hypothetical protein IAT38_000222 [Cryptococcus sp. DSM 104549]